jgi:hypothetical protein
LHPHWHPLVVTLFFRIGHSTILRQESLDELGLGVPCLVAVVHVFFGRNTAASKPAAEAQQPTTKILSLVMKSVSHEKCFTLTRTGIGGRMAAVFGV